MDNKGRTIMLDGVNVYYEHHGRDNDDGAPVLILVHGYLSSCFSFRLLVPYLKEYTIYALDLPGFGESEKSQHFTYSLYNYGRLVLHFMEAMGIKKAALIGHSMGGQICLNAARQRPDMVKKLVCLCAAGYMGRVKKQLIVASYVPFMHHILRLYFKKRNVMNDFLSVVYDQSFINDEMVNGYLKPLQSSDFYRSLIRFIRHREGDLHSEQLKDIQQPVLLLWGREDKIVPVNIGERFSRDLPKATFKVYEKTGHLLPEERPKEVSKEINAFISMNKSN